MFRRFDDSEQVDIANGVRRGAVSSGTDSAGEQRASASYGDEASLVAGLRRHDERAYNRLVDRYSRPLFKAALRILNDEDEAWDCVQEGFLTALRKIDEFEGRSQVSSWLHRIVVNSALMKRRSRLRKGEVSLDEEGFDLDREAHGASTASAEATVIDDELSAQVRHAIAQLPDAHRLILQLRDIENFDTAETAARLGISPGAVKTRLHRARAALKPLLAPLSQAL